MPLVRNSTLTARIILLIFLSIATQAASARTVTVDHGAQDPAVSPDGSRVAVSILGKIWVLPRKGGEAQQISEGISWDSNPAWSSDGTLLAYAQELPNGSDLIIRNLNTGNSQILYHTENLIQQIAFAPSQHSVFFLVRSNQYDSHLWTIAANGRDAKQLTLAKNWHETSFALSPDGKRVFLDSGRYGGSNLYMLEVGPFKSVRLTRAPDSQYSVGWSHDGKLLAYIENVNGRESVMVQDAGNPQFAPRRVFSSPYDDKQLALDPDGRTAVLCAGRRLYSLDLSAGKSQPIPFAARFSLPEQSRPDLLIIHARVLAGADYTALENATVEIRAGKISAVRKGMPEPGESGVPVLDATGKTVLPGLMDNHYHFWYVFSGPQLLAHGITSIRDPGSDLSNTLNFKEAAALGLVPAPHVYAAGPLIDGPGGYHPMVDVEIDDPQAAPALVRSLKQQGVDALKVYFMLKPEVLRAVVQEAHAQGLRVTGHIGVRTGWEEAMDAGIDGFNHIRLWHDFLPLSEQPQGESENLDGEKNPIARMQADWSQIDPNGEKAGAVIRKMVEHRIGFDPTLAIQKVGESLQRSVGMEQFETMRETYKRMSQFVARAQKAGVPLLAGTDNGSLFDELESYASAGIPNIEIVKAATVNGARWLGKDSEFGTIEPGKRADLLIVEGDPLADIKDLRKISAVIQDGRVVFSK